MSRMTIRSIRDLAEEYQKKGLPDRSLRDAIIKGEERARVMAAAQMKAEIDRHMPPQPGSGKLPPLLYGPDGEALPFEAGAVWKSIPEETRKILLDARAETTGRRPLCFECARFPVKSVGDLCFECEARERRDRAQQRAAAAQAAQAASKEAFGAWMTEHLPRMTAEMQDMATKFGARVVQEEHKPDKPQYQATTESKAPAPDTKAEEFEQQRRPSKGMHYTHSLMVDGGKGYPDKVHIVRPLLYETAAQQGKKAIPVNKRRIAGFQVDLEEEQAAIWIPFGDFDEAASDGDRALLYHSPMEFLEEYGKAMVVALRKKYERGEIRPIVSGGKGLPMEGGVWSLAQEAKVQVRERAPMLPKKSLVQVLVSQGYTDRQARILAEMGEAS